MVLTPFTSERWLARLNVAAVAATLAGCTVVTLGTALSAPAWAIGLPTAYLGAIWAMVLRHRATIGSSRIRWGWLASIPLAALNGGLCCAALFATQGQGGFDIAKVLMGIALGATFGVFLWGPALIVTLACFGVPIAWAQRLAARGLAGTERGERIVGAACVVLGALAVALAWSIHRSMPDLESPFYPPSRASDSALGGAFAAVGALFGSLAFIVAIVRERRRAAFVRRVEAGDVPRFRVDDTPEGKVLLRVETHGAGAYRVADLEEEICLLDEAGRAVEVRARATELARR